MAHYTHGLGLTTRVDATAAAHYYDFNAIGSTIGLTDGMGHYVNEYMNLPFGETLIATETIDNPFEFGGQWGVTADSDELTFMRARFYQPRAGAFVSVVGDAVGSVAGSLIYDSHATRCRRDHARRH